MSTKDPYEGWSEADLRRKDLVMKYDQALADATQAAWDLAELEEKQGKERRGYADYWGMVAQGLEQDEYQGPEEEDIKARFPQEDK